MSVFLTPERKPFFAGTYFPKSRRYGTIGFRELLAAIQDSWQHRREALLESAEAIVSALSRREAVIGSEEDLTERAIALFKDSFDSEYGGFGRAPKFPSPHNLLFLLRQYQKRGDRAVLHMAEKTLEQMYRGGIFDHIGYGFSRYSTDRYYLVPHFEKMLYDNALLMLVYAEAFMVTGKRLYLEVAEKAADFLLSEMRLEGGGFASAMDADSDGVEGRYYTFSPQEITEQLGETEGAAFCKQFGITEAGNFEGKSIPNLLHTEADPAPFDPLLPRLRVYRKNRAALHTDDKVLTAWNGLTIAGLCTVYKASGKECYLTAAKETLDFLNRQLREGSRLYVSLRAGKRSGGGFLDDYASYLFALLSLYDVTLERSLLSDAVEMTEQVIRGFFDREGGGFYLYGTEGENLILRPKESYDGAVPSGNSLMTCCLVRLEMLCPDEDRQRVLDRQIAFMSGEAAGYPAGYAMFLTAASDRLEPPDTVTVVQGSEGLAGLPLRVRPGTLLRVLDAPAPSYRTIDHHTTLYVCTGGRCLPPMTLEDYCKGKGQ